MPDRNDQLILSKFGLYQKILLYIYFTEPDSIAYKLLKLMALKVLHSLYSRAITGIDILECRRPVRYEVVLGQKVDMVHEERKLAKVLLGAMYLWELKI